MMFSNPIAFSTYDDRIDTLVGVPIACTSVGRRDSAHLVRLVDRAKVIGQCQVAAAFSMRCAGAPLPGTCDCRRA